MLQLPVDSFPKREMEKMQARLTKALTRIFGIVAENLMNGTKNPYDVEDWEICNNGVSRSKELRILQVAGALPYSNHTVLESSQSRYGRGYYKNYHILHDYEKLFNDISKEYMTELVFPDIPDSISRFIAQDELSSGFDTSKESLRYTGYKDLRNQSPSEKIYVYHNRDLYDTRVMKSGRYHEDTYLEIYPKAMLETRTKAVIKAVMKKYCEEDLLVYLNSRFDINLEGLSQKLGDSHTDMEYKFELRNTSRYPTTFNKYCYEVSHGNYTLEYQRVTESINNEFSRIKKFKEAVDEAGGTTIVLDGYIKTSIDNLVAKSVTLINGEQSDIDALQFILDHRDIITYDYLYGPTFTHKEIQ